MEDLDYVSQIDDGEMYRKYVRDLIIFKPETAHLSNEQNYLRCLVEITGPILSAYRLKGRIHRSQRRTHILEPWSKFEESGKMLAMEAYHFKARIRLLGEAISAVISDELSKKHLAKDIGRAIRGFEATNVRLLKYRNFVVHGPKGRVDEFEGLRGMALSAHLLHDDLWLEYNNVFDETKEEWISISSDLIRSMEKAISEIQLLNENLLSTGALTFVSQELTSVSGSKSIYRATPEELAGVDRGLRDAAEGKFATDEEVEATFAKHRVKI